MKTTVSFHSDFYSVIIPLITGGTEVGLDRFFFFFVFGQIECKIYLVWVCWNGFMCLGITSRSKPWLVGQGWRCAAQTSIAREYLSMLPAAPTPSDPSWPHTEAVLTLGCSQPMQPVTEHGQSSRARPFLPGTKWVVFALEYGFS